MTPRVRLGAAAVLTGWSGLVLLWLAVAGASGGVPALRVLLIGPLLVAGPGTACALLLRFASRALCGVVAVLVSCPLLVLMAQASLYSGHWAPLGVGVAQLVLTLLLSAVALLRERHAAHV